MEIICACAYTARCGTNTTMSCGSNSTCNGGTCDCISGFLSLMGSNTDCANFSGTVKY